MPKRPSSIAERIHDVIDRLFSGSSRWRSGGSCSWAQIKVLPSTPVPAAAAGLVVVVSSAAGSSAGSSVAGSSAGSSAASSPPHAAAIKLNAASAATTRPPRLILFTLFLLGGTGRSVDTPRALPCPKLAEGYRRNDPPVTHGYMCHERQMTGKAQPSVGRRLATAAESAANTENTTNATANGVTEVVIWVAT